MAAVASASKFDDSYKPSNYKEQQLSVNNNNNINNNNNEVYRLVTEMWPSKANHKSNTDSNNHYSVGNNNNSKLGHANNPQLTALVSFPGSGNTWLRYLLQQATGE